jgi:hypothetical protein
VEVRGGGLATLSSRGHLEAFEGEDFLQVSQNRNELLYKLERSVAVKLLRTESFTLRPQQLSGLLALRSRRLEDIEVSEQAQRKALLQRAMGMDVARVVMDLSTYGDGAQMPDHARWVWRATGALKLDPSGCAELAKLAKDPSRSSDGRRFMTELLVSVGSPEAQAALREILTAETAQQDPKYYDTLQRLSLLERPEPETAALVRDLLKAETFEVRMGGAFTAGSLAQTLSALGEETQASQLNNELQALLQNARTIDDQAGYISALGNAGRAENVPLIAKSVGSESAEVRRSAANALRHTQTPEAEEAVLSLASDEQERVQSAALETLEGWKLEVSHLEALEDTLNEGRVLLGNRSSLAKVLSKEYRSQDAAKAEVSKRMLEKMIAGPLPTSLRYKLDGLLKGESAVSDSSAGE